MMTLEQRAEQQELIASLRPGDVIEFRYTNRPKGEWPWSGEPFIFEYMLPKTNGLNPARVVHAKRPFDPYSQVFDLNEVEIRVLARSGEQI